MADSATRSPGGHQWLPRAVRWWAAGLAFVVGLLAGALLVGLLSGGGTVPAPATGDAAATTAPGGADASPDEAPADTAGELVVNAACLRTVNAAQDVFDVLDDLGEALSELNAGRLDSIVRQLQPLQDRLQVNLAECNVAAEIAEVDEEEAGSGPEAPTTAPPPIAPPPTIAPPSD